MNGTLCEHYTSNRRDCRTRAFYERKLPAFLDLPRKLNTYDSVEEFEFTTP